MYKYILILLLVTSCATTKNKKQTETSTIERTLTTRAGDTLVYVVPNIKYRDTTIYHKNFENPASNTLKIVYDKQGNQTEIKCISDEINELREYINTFKEDSKVKESNFNNVIIIYVFIGLAFLIIINKISNKFLI
jgi:hypothetical protein